MERGFQVRKVATVKRRQLPVTGAYTFPGYQAQGQTIPYVVVDGGRETIDLATRQLLNPSFRLSF